MTGPALIAAMPEALALEICAKLFELDRPLYKECLDILAKSKRVRRVVIERMPRSERHPEILAMLRQNAYFTLSLRALTSWLILANSKLLCAFLDGLGIEHDEFGCADTFPPSPGKAKLQSVVDTMLTSYPADRVATYLHAFNAMPDTNWPELAEILEIDTRLKLGA